VGRDCRAEVESTEDAGSITVAKDSAAVMAEVGAGKSTVLKEFLWVLSIAIYCLYEPSVPIFSMSYDQEHAYRCKGLPRCTLKLRLNPDHSQQKEVF